ncbi:hypothetical protein DFH11DRAFT_1565300 [Phellopilus nigrolimitatus]|nr:hypothetical protein DFH11DRAFT_1565300 [Phellopilus nigrolimitatus]
MSKGADPVTQFLISRPQGGDVLVGGVRLTVFPLQNNKLGSWDNNTDDTQEYTQEYTSELKVTKGSEVGNAINLPVAFQSVEISAEYGQKTFSRAETTDPKTEITVVEVPPRSELFFYQREYVFRSDVFFIVDAGNEKWIVGSVTGNSIVHTECEVVINSADYFTTRTELTGETEINVDTTRVSDFTKGREILKFDDCTERTKNVLRAMGIDGVVAEPRV